MRNEKLFIDKIIQFTSFIEKLKKIERFKGQYYWKDYYKRKRFKSVADHTWRLCVLLLLCSDKLSKKIDLIKAFKIALIHDMPEIISGDASPMGKDGTGMDTHAYNIKIRKLRFRKEDKASKELFVMLPKRLSKEYYNLWLDYEKGISYEGKLVKALDKIECMLQVHDYRKGHMFKNHLNFTINYGLKYSDIDLFISDLGGTIANLMRKNYKEYKIKNVEENNYFIFRFLTSYFPM